MNENLNLVAILNNCINGTKLYSSVFGEVELDHIDTSANYPIIIRLKGEQGYESLTSGGKMFADYDGECILFPSREERDWSKFKPTCEFKDGDILSYQCKGFNNRSIYIYRYHKRFNTSYYVALSGDNNEFMIDNIGRWALNGYNDTARFATEEEKQKLFQAIKDKGYKWNAGTKTLEKLVKPKFDPKTLKPFDKVIARCSDFKWVCDMFSHYDKSKCVMPYVCVGGFYEVCIPYNDETKHLLGTTEEAPEYYRYWENQICRL